MPSPPSRIRATRLFAIVGSAGGFPAIRKILSVLPVGLDAAVAVVLHRAPSHADSLPPLLGRFTRLRVKAAEDGEDLLQGVVYIAPPDRHLTISPEGRFRLMDGPRIRYARSSANPLFETAARFFGERLTAVVLTGGDGDGTEGVQAVAQHRGSVIVQDPATALVPDMPRSAIATGVVRLVLDVDAIGPQLASLASAAA